jgi:hypothetical protein
VGSTPSSKPRAQIASILSCVPTSRRWRERSAQERRCVSPRSPAEPGAFETRRLSARPHPLRERAPPLSNRSVAARVSFVLKGAALFTLWTGKPHRATRDLDLLGFGDPSEAHIRDVFTEILAQEVPNDGVRFDLGSLAVGLIREGQEYRICSHGAPDRPEFGRLIKLIERDKQLHGTREPRGRRRKRSPEVCLSAEPGSHRRKDLLPNAVDTPVG